MYDNWDILLRELAKHGIKIENSKYCLFYYNGKLVRSKIKTKIKHIAKNLKENFTIFKSLWQKASEELSQCNCPIESNQSPVDHRTKNIFLQAISGLGFLGELLSDTCHDIHNYFVIESKILSKIKAASCKDIKLFTRETEANASLDRA